MSRRWVVDASAMCALVALALLPLWSAFQDARFWVTAGGAILIGAALAVVGAARRWSLLVVAAVVVVAYFLVSSALAFPSRALWGVVPTLDTLVASATGVVRVWKEALTLPPPFAGVESMYVVPLVLALLVTVVSVSLALRVRLFALALLAPGAALVGAIALSTFDSVAPAAVGASFGVVALAWSVWRTRRAKSTDPVDAAGPVPTRSVALPVVAGVSIALIVAGAGAVGAAAATAAPLGDRQVVRDHVVPPLELHDYASPLTVFRKYTKEAQDDGTLFTLSGLPQGARIRLATLDSYDGVVYSVSGAGSGGGTFARVGRRIEPVASGEPAHVQVTMGALHGVWMPTVGYLTSVGFDGSDAVERDGALHYNAATGTALVTTGMAEGDTYAFDTVIPAAPTEEQLEDAAVSPVTTPAPQRVPDDLVAVDTATAGAETPAAQVRAIEAYFQTNGYFSHGLEGQVASRSGHSLARESDLFSQPQMVGDDEQYAVAMALMVSQLGLPVRVVMGFSGKNEGLPGGTVDVTGEQLHAWVEVPFEGYGWVPFWPTPAEDKVPQEEVPEQRQKPRAQVAQPPDQPQEPAQLPPAPPVEEARADQPTTDLAWLWTTLQIAGWSLGAVVVLFGPSVFLGILRVRRRRRRAGGDDHAERMAGGWAELVDTARDAGTSVGAGATRREQAAALDERFPQAGVGALAVRADAGVFGAATPSDAEVAAYWTDVDTAVGGIRRSVRWPQRLAARFFPASVWSTLLRRRGRRS
jgi:transglutaminase-like putative cysteine protease